MEQNRGKNVGWIQNALAEPGCMTKDDSVAFTTEGEPVGVLNGISAAALVRYNQDRNLGSRVLG